METVELFQRLGLALAIGFLIGIERGWREREGAAGSRVAGIRTYALIGLLGGVWGALYPVVGGVALGLVALGFAI
ncbi:MAG: MgtC/SapB family protein, partial [Alphaproteobacteria bacterium]|nr:MgtC/SapB family protein [Alphaproteobacteria bacterium]